MAKKRIKDSKKSVWRKEKYSLLAQGLGKCLKCFSIKELNIENFSERTDNKTGFSSWCRICQREHAKVKMRNKRSDPIENIAVQASKIKHIKSEKGITGKRARNTIRNHKKRSLIFIWTEQNWIDCKAYFENKCAYCLSEDNITQDHFIPLNDENCPGTIVKNMVPACLKCNCSKQDKSPYQFCSPGSLIRIENYFASLNN
jgi:hypothetical protein